MKKTNQTFWHFFTSMKTGIILLGLIVLVAGLGTFISLDVYSSVCFKLLLGILCINIIACSISRFKGLRKRIHHPPIPRNINAVPHKICSSITGTNDDLFCNLEKNLRSRGYRFTSAETDDGWAFVAQKYRFGYWGAYIVHIAFVIIIIGAMMGTLGFSGGFMALKGEVVSFNQIPLNKGSATKDYEIKINSVEDRYLANGERDNWYTNISILREGKELARGNTSVNHPFSYDGVKYYQSRYADYALIVIEKNNIKQEELVMLGQTSNEKEISYELSHRFKQRVDKSDLYVKGLKLQNRPIVYLQIFVTDKGEPSVVKLTPGQNRLVFDEYKITLLELTNATGLEIKSDPGVPIVWLGSGTLLLGLIISFYWRPLLVSGIFTPQDRSGTLLMGMYAGKTIKQNEAEFNGILKELQRIN